MMSVPSLLFIACLAAGGGRDDLIASLTSSDPQTRRAAAAAAGEHGATSVAAVAALLDHADPDIAKTAGQALDAIAHHAARPGADAERLAFNQAILTALASGTGEDRSRGALLRLLAWTGQDDVVAAVGGLSRDIRLGGDALYVLTAIPTPAATQALIDRLRSDTVANDALIFQPTVLIDALGARCDGRAVAVLIEIVRGEAVDAAQHARRALARIGDPRALSVLSAAARRGLRHADQDLLRLAAAIGRSGDPAVALTIYQRYLRSTQAALRTAAIAGIGALDRASNAAMLTAALGDHDGVVAGTAEQALARLRGASVTGELSAAYASADAANRPALLRLLAQREAIDGSALIAALRDDDRALRLAAIAIARQRDDATLAEPLLELVDADDEEQRDAALLASIDVAARDLTRGERHAALDRAHRCLTLAATPATQTAALRLIARIASASSLSYLDELDPVFDEGDRERACIAIAPALSTSSAIALLEKIIATSRSRGRRQEAAQAIGALGVDTSAYAPRAGCLTRWQLIGPLPAASADDIRTLPFDPTAVSEADVQVGGTTLPWRVVTTDDLDGMIDLARLFENQENACAIGLAEFRLDSATDAILKAGSDDGIVLWLNGQLIHDHLDARGLTVDQDRIPCHLNAGWNQVIVKITQGGGGWGFCVRVADAAGTPIDLTALGY